MQRYKHSDITERKYTKNTTYLTYFSAKTTFICTLLFSFLNTTVRLSTSRAPENRNLKPVCWKIVNRRMK